MAVLALDAAETISSMIPDAVSATAAAALPPQIIIKHGLLIHEIRASTASSAANVISDAVESQSVRSDEG